MKEVKNFILLDMLHRYRLWNPEKRKIIISRDVKFGETNREKSVKINKIKFFQ